jgi:SAM-dependent methyltransferase
MDNRAAACDLRAEYRLRFSPLQDYRNRVWKVLAESFFQKFIPAEASVLDLGCGWGEFINHIRAAKKWGMDLNPDAPAHLEEEVTFLQQNCSQAWPLPDESLDVVFSSNFFEHLPTKADLQRTLQEAYRTVKTGGKLICLGPNIRFLAGSYWDFWDHHLPLTDRSLAEVLRMTGFRIELQRARFLPYTMVDKAPAPLFLIRWYLRFPLLWRFFGKQFLIVAEK